MGVNNKMKIYKTTRCVTQWDVDEKDFLNFLKTENLHDEDIQKAENLKELIEEFGDIDEFSADLDKYLNSDICKMDIFSSSNHYYDNYIDAYDEMEYGLH
jgi:hypothetical protein